MIKKVILFLIINFSALALGSMFTSEGVISSWYQNLPKAPWTPPGWLFGVAWTIIMICFSVYMAILLNKKSTPKIIALFCIQWVLNVSWNPIFFYFQQVLLGVIIILLLTVVVHIFLFYYRKVLGWNTIFILPYAIWLWIATSLNMYIYLNI